MKLHIEIGSQEWLDLRRWKITATDACIIMGVSKWTTPLQLYNRKVTGEELEKTEAMERGNFLEPQARAKFEEIMGCKVTPDCWLADRDQWQMATFDGINEDGMLVEIKCPGKDDHNSALLGLVPEHYYPQLQHQMLVAGLHHMYYFSYAPQQQIPFALVKVLRDQDYCDDMIREELEFMTRLSNRIPPERCERDMVKIDDPEFHLMERRLRDLTERQKEIEEEIDFLRTNLISRCPSSINQGSLFKFSCHSSKGAVEYAKIPELRGVNLDSYRKPPIQKWRVDLL